MPVRDPLAVGENSIEIVQLFCAVSDVEQVLVLMLKSPLICGALSVAVLPPVFATTIFCAALVAPTLVFGKLSNIGVRPTFGSATPLPDNDATTVATVPLVLIEICPLRVPVAVGVKTTLMLQLADAASDVVQLFALMLKSPLICGVPSVAVVPPEFCTTRICAVLLAPRFVPANVSVVGVIVTSAAV